MVLYIIRHAEPIYETDSLTELGFKQADALAERLAAFRIDKVFSSPLGRAKLTAKPTCEKFGLECVIEDWMSEGLAWQDFSADFGDGKGRRWTIYRHNAELRYDKTIPEGGTWQDSDYQKGSNAVGGWRRIGGHSDEFLERLGYKNEEGKGYKVIRPNDDRVAAFCHHGFGTTWLAYLLGIAPNLIWAGFNIHASGVTILHFGNHESGYVAPMCACWSDWSHVYKAGLPMGV